MRALVISEYDNECIADACLATITAAKQVADEVNVLVAGHNCRTVAEAFSHVENVARVLYADAEHYDHGLAEELAPLMVSVAQDYDFVLAPATTFGRNLLPRVAAILGVDQLSDVLSIESADTFIRPVYAGNALVTVRSRDTIKLLTIRATGFEVAAREGGSANINTIECTQPVGLSRFVRRMKSSDSERPDLATARVVVSGGRGLGSEENFRLVEELAQQLDAAVGATRAAVDAGFVPNDYQVGQTGKIIAPDLYIAIGISGAIQHLAGINDSKIIVAINKDAEAPIFDVADYGLVADLFEVLPELSEIIGNLDGTA